MFESDAHNPPEKGAADLKSLAFQTRLLSSVHDAIVAADENHRITYWNAPAEKMFGWRAEEVIGKPTAGIFQTAVPDSPRENAIEKMMKRDFYEGDVIYRHKEGREIYTHVHASVLRDEKGDFKGTASSFRDITDRKKLEAALEESENRYRAIFENAGEGIAYVDSKGVYLYANRAFADMLGYAPDEIPGKTGADFSFEGEQPDVRQIPGSFNQGGAFCGESRFRRKDGSELWTRFSGVPFFNAAGEHIADIAMHTDITERRKAEDALRKSEERLHSLVNSMLDEVWFADTSGTVTIVNPTVIQEFGRPSHGESIEHIASSLQVFHSDGSPRPVEEAPLWRALNGEVIKNLEEIIRTPASGELRFRQVNAAPVKDIDGGIIGAVAVVRDIAEKKRVENALAAERKRFFEMLETLPVMVCLMTSDYHVVFANRAFREKFGESGGRHCYDYCCGFSEPCPFCESFIPFKTGQPHHWEFVHGGVHIDAYDFPFIDSDGSTLILEMDIDITERRRAEKALKLSEERYRTLFQSMGEGFAIAEMEFDPAGKPVDYTVLEINQAFERQTGLHPGQVLGKRVTEFFDCVEPQWFERYGQVVISGQPQRFEEYNASLDRWFSVHAFPLPIKNHFGMILGDITERKHFEEKLARQGYLLDSVYDAVVATDMNFSITYWNKAAERTYGWTAEEAIGQNVDALLQTVFIGEDHEEAIRRLIQSKSVEVEVAHARKDGSSVNVTTKVSLVYSNHGQLAGTVGVLRDITERKKAEEALRQSEERQMFLLKLSDAIRPLGDPASIVETASRLTGEHFGVTRVMYAEIDRDPDTVVVARDWARSGVKSAVGRYRMDDFGTFVAKLLRSGLPVIVEDVARDPRISPDERRNWELVNTLSSISFPRMKDGHLVAYFTLYHDKPHHWTKGEAELIIEIAERAWAAAERANAEKLLRESEKKALALVEKLEDADRNKNQFLSVLSHELRNPLAAISTGIELLGVTKDARQAAKVKEILDRQTNQLCKLVDDLLELTRITQNKIKLKKETVNLNGIVKGAAEDIAPEYERKGIKLVTSIPPMPVLLSADPVRIAQMTGNLLVNALKFTPTGGTVRLTLTSEADHAVIVVKDDGMGIDPEMLPHLFTPFIQADNHTLDRSHSGLGLGLSIVKGMAALHEGDVTAFSDGLGSGSTFTIRLPIAGAEDLKPEAPATGSGGKKNLKLLIIEDNRDFADLLSAMLASTGYRVSMACDGTDGVSKAKQIKPDVILCDIGLPGMSGFDVADSIRSDGELKDAYLVALTGYAGEADVERAKKAGFHKHLAKPVNLAALEQLLQEYRRSPGP